MKAIDCPNGLVTGSGNIIPLRTTDSPDVRDTAQTPYAVASLFSRTNSECSNLPRTFGSLSTVISHNLDRCAAGVTWVVCVSRRANQSAPSDLADSSTQAFGTTISIVSGTLD